MYRLTYTSIGERTEDRDPGSKQSESENGSLEGGRWMDRLDDKTEKRFSKCG